MEKLNFCHFLNKMYLNLVALGDNIIFLLQFFGFRGGNFPPAGVHVLVLPLGSADALRGFSILKHSRYDRRSSLKTATFDGILRIRINCPEEQADKEIRPDATKGKFDRKKYLKGSNLF